jgi:WXG100 family type VII secretion target
MSDEIKADYEALEAISSKFADQSSEMGKMLQQVKRSMDPLENGGWVGRGSNSFFSEMNGEVIPASDRLVRALEEAGQITNQISQKVKQAEEEASGLFKGSSF